MKSKKYKPKIPTVSASKTNRDSKFDFFIEIPIKGCEQLRKKLKVDDGSYGWVYGPNVSNPRDYFLYGVFNETEKAGVTMMREFQYVADSKKDFDPKKHDDKARISQNILQSSIDQLAIWQRKLTEMLIDLIGFRRANNEDYYRHYITLYELSEKNKINQEFLDFYNCSNQNLAQQITDLGHQADQLATKLDPNKCWYVLVRNGVIKRKLLPFNQRLSSILPHMKDSQRAIIRTYGSSFGMQSDLLHPKRIAGHKNLNLDDIENHIMRIGILSLHVVVAAKDVMQIHNVKGYLKTLADLAKKNDYPVTLLKQKTRPGIKVGDYVVAYGDLAQVVKINKSKFGYLSFRIKYLEQPPLPNITEDEFTAEYVHLLYTRQPLLESVRNKIIEISKTPKPKTSDLEKVVTQTIVDFWSKLGLKEITLGNPDAGYEKLANHLDEMKEKAKSIAD